MTRSFFRLPSPGRGKLLIGAALLGAAALLSLAWKPAPGEEPGDAIARLYGERAAEFTNLARAFHEGLGALPSTPRGTAELRRRIDALRLAYKRIEFLVDYAHPGIAARLNPPPLERADLSSPSALDILPAEGLQILMELAHEDDPWRERESLEELAMRLDVAAQDLRAMLPDLLLDDRMLFEAMENQVIRVVTMGITGFDAPAQSRALPETRAGLEAMRPVLDLYLPTLKRRDAALASRLAAAFDKAVSRLPVKESAGSALNAFDAFDRAGYIREAGNPLYAALVDAHHALDIATFEDFPHMTRPVNPRARDLFASDFLNPHFYSGTPGEKPDARAAALGRRLFFDPVLSGDGSRSCASCHDPRKAFSDGLPKSPALGGGTLQRNSPSLTHAAYQANQFWDMREKTLEMQIFHVVEGEAEFRSSLLSVVGAIHKNPDYVREFREVFGGEDEEGRKREPDIGMITKALAMYLRSFGNWNSPFDRYMRGETEFLDPAARRGFNLFMGKAQCATCHFPPAFNGTVPPKYLETESEVLGVPEKFPAPVPVLDPDRGRGGIHFASIFRGSFKTPTVRNVELTAPYMHNGGIATLEDVVEFYNAGGGTGLGLDVPHQTLPVDSLGLTPREVADIVAFMKSLTDTTGLNTPDGY